MRQNILGVAIGTMLGFLYYHFVGCKSGGCLITGTSWGSMAYGALFGGVLFSWRRKK